VQEGEHNFWDIRNNNNKELEIRLIHFIGIKHSNKKLNSVNTSEGQCSTKGEMRNAYTIFVL
jgi:uncharacterized protein YpiB (UPF0302 family)